MMPEYEIPLLFFLLGVFICSGHTRSIRLSQSSLSRKMVICDGKVLHFGSEIFYITTSCGWYVLNHYLSNIFSLNFIYIFFLVFFYLGVGTRAAGRRGSYCCSSSPYCSCN